MLTTKTASRAKFWSASHTPSRSQNRTLCGVEPNPPLGGLLYKQNLLVGRIGRIRKNLNKIAYSTPIFLRCTISIDMAAGVTPEMRDACPMEPGSVRASFSFVSLERP